MSEERPRPQFGEYATPEEQQRARGIPVEAPAALSRPAPAAPEAAPAVPAASIAPSRRLDRIATFALLAYGLFTVVMSGLSNRNLGPVMNQVMGQFGIEGEFTNVAAARFWGLAATLVLVIGWTLTALLSVRRMRRGRITWWLPLVGAAVSLTLSSFCLVVPILGDPAFIEFLQRAATS